MKKTFTDRTNRKPSTISLNVSLNDAVVNKFTDPDTGKVDLVGFVRMLNGTGAAADRLYASIVSVRMKGGKVLTMLKTDEETFTEIDDTVESVIEALMTVNRCFILTLIAESCNPEEDSPLFIMD